MQRINREDAYEYEFAAKEPVLIVDQDESFIIEAEDVSAGVRRRDGQGRRWAITTKK